MIEVYGRDLFKDKLRNELQITQAYLIKWVKSKGGNISRDALTAFSRNPNDCLFKTRTTIMSALKEIEEAKSCSLEWDKETKETLIEENYRRGNYGR